MRARLATALNMLLPSGALRVGIYNVDGADETLAAGGGMRQRAAPGYRFGAPTLTIASSWCPGKGDCVMPNDMHSATDRYQELYGWLQQPATFVDHY